MASTINLADLTPAQYAQLLAQAREADRSAREAIAEPGIHENVPMTSGEIGCNTLAKIVHTTDDGIGIVWLARMRKAGDASPAINVKVGNGFTPGIVADAEDMPTVLAAIAGEGPAIMKKLATAYRKAAKSHRWIAKAKK